MRIFFGFLLSVLFIQQQGFTQDFSNKGKEFWVGYGSHVSMYNTNGTVNNITGGSQQMVLYFTSDKNATVTVSIPGLGWSKSYPVIANQVTPSDLMPKIGATDARIFAEGKTNRGIRITSDVPIIAYAHIYNGSVSGATLLFPTTTLSREYYAINFKQSSNEANSFCYAYVIATEDNTNIEIIPSVNTFNNNAGDTIKVVLNQGEVYNVFGKVISSALGEDLTGTRIRSVATPGNPCKKIAVFSGSGKINITCNGSTGGSADNYIQQAFPSNAWGKRYLTAPTSRMPFNYYRICVSDPSAVVKRNGVALTGLIKNFYYEYLGNSADLIESDKPIMVAQYITTRENCSNPKFTFFNPSAPVNAQTESLGDPEMIYLSPIEQTIEKVTINSTPNAVIREHWLNVVVKSSAAASLRVDGLLPAATPLTHPRDAAYSYFQIPLSQGAHTITSDSGFNAIAYGYGSAESYGYNAGANVKDLYQYVSTANQYATVNSPVACKGSPFEFAITLPYVPLSMTWKIPNYPDFINPGPVVPDSSFVLNGRNLYIYKLPTPYVYNTVGLFNVKVNVNNPTADGCSGEQTIDFDLQVYDQPTSDFTFVSSGCTDSAVVFTSTANTGGRPISKHYWDFGDGTYGNTANPTKTYLTPGTFTVKYVALTDIGCISDTVTKTITLTNIPVAKFGILDSLCIGKVLIFRDSSTLAGGFGNITNWNWSTGIGGPINNTSSADITATYATTGNYTTSLQLRTNSGCYSPVYQKSITIRPKPTVDFTISHGCLPDPVINFNSTSTIADGTQAGFGYAWNFGDPASGTLNTATVKSPSHLYPSAGPFNVQLIITSQYGCIDSVTKVADQIYPQPKANFTAPAEVCWQTPITFTDGSNGFTHPVVKWEWRFSDGTTSTQKNPVKNFTNPGTYTATLWVFTDQNCVSDTVVKTVVVNPWPTASFTMSALQCEKNAITFTSTSVANAGNLNRSYWDFGDGNTANVTTLSTTHTYTNWGNYTVKFVTETDKGCRNDTLLKPVLVNPLPKPDFTISHGCLPDPVINFNSTSTIADGTQAGFGYAWNFGDPASGTLNTATVKSPSHLYPSAGPFNVQLIITSQYGCIDSVTKVADQIYPQPKANFTAPAEVCWQTPITFTDGSNGFTHPVVKWEWRFSDGTTSTQKNPVKNFTNPGTYTATLWVFTDQNCVSDTVVKTVVVNPWPTASFTMSALQCEKNAITFTSTSVANAGNLNRSYWDFGDGNTANVTTLSTTHTYTNWGNYTVKFVTETDKGCRNDTLLKPVLVNPLPKVGYILPEVCLNDGVATFIDTSSMADGSASQLKYLWKFNTGSSPVVPAPSPLTSTQKTPTINFYIAQNYQLNLTVESKDGCVDSVTNVPYTINGVIAKADYSIIQNGLCSNQEIKIQNKSTVVFGWLTKVEIYWDWANNPTQVEVDDEPAVDEIYAHKYPDFQTPLTKTYKVRIRVFSGIICEKDYIQDVVVNASPFTTFTAMPGICVDAAPRQITEATENGGLPKLSETYSGPGVSATGLFDPAAAGVGIHTIRYTFTALNGCTHYSESQIEVWPRPTAQLNVLSPNCEKNAITFNSNGSQSNAASLSSWQWNYGDNTPTDTTTSNTPVTHVYAVYGNYTANLIVTNNRGCNSLPQPLNLTVHPLPVIDFSLPKICLPDGKGQFNDLTTIPDNTQSTFKYRWDFGDNNVIPVNADTSVLKNPYYQYRNLGPYTVQLKVLTENGCIDSISKQLIDVFPQPKAGFSTSADSICIGESIDFKDESDGIVRTITKWKWSFGNGDSSFVANPRYRFPSSSTVPYTVQLFVYSAEGCVSDTASKPINVWSYPVVTAGPDITMLQDGLRKITDARATGNLVQFLWSPATYLDSTTVNNPSIVRPQDDITYTFTVTGRGGCETSDDVFVKILKAPKPPNTFTPNGDGINDFWEIKFMNDYPGAVIEVYNTAGSLIYRSVGYSTPWDGKWKGQPLPAGTYYYAIDPKNGRKRISGYVTILR